MVDAHLTTALWFRTGSSIVHPDTSAGNNYDMIVYDND